MRLSNFELLRLISMFMVLIVHSNFQAIGTPTHIDLQIDPITSILRIMLQSFTLVCVNIFVFISGWFGIKFSYKGILQLLFQTFFFLFGIYFICVFVGLEKLSLLGLGKCLMLNNGTWFVKSYLCLYIISPILNLFIENSSQKDFKRVLFLFYLFQFIWGWASKGVSFFEEGLSTISFIGLYLLARYIYMYKPKISLYPKQKYMFAYIVFSILTALCLWITILKEYSFYYKFWSYNSPLIILASIALFLFFSKLNFKNKIINNLAVSCFAVYLLHFIIWKEVVSPFIQYIVYKYDTITCLIYILILLIAFYATAIIMDKIRIRIWNLLINIKVKRSQQ